MVKRIEFKTMVKIFLLFITLTLTSFLIVKGIISYLFISAPVVLFQLYNIYHSQRKAFVELNNFIESVKYKDFSRHFNVSQAPVELQGLRRGFNQINDAFKVMSNEKELQYQYLQKILELVNTGILSYNAETGVVLWINESLKQMLQLPYLKTIHSLEKRDTNLYNEIIQLKPGDGKITDAHPEKGSFKVLLSATAFQTEGQKFMLIAFQNINEAVDETEAKAWQKLLSVMTHEIMNSVAPISSLADTLKNRLEKSIPHIDNKNGAVLDLEIGIDTIKRRSESLLKFAETYRNLNKIANPNLKKILLRDLFENLYQLMQPTLDQKNIEMDIVLKDRGLEIEVDISLIEQVVINLLVNAIDAVKDRANARIILSASVSDNQKILLKVSDNGPGIPEGIMENIFIPFFSTKKNGSGIGLSLCKQIMMLHKGNIQVHSIIDKGTVFTLQF
ncbi:MAG: HAMP domain-containing sensor histidine kinase [Ginsengibacter sp.]